MTMSYYYNDYNIYDMKIIKLEETVKNLNIKLYVSETELKESRLKLINALRVSNEYQQKMIESLKQIIELTEANERLRMKLTEANELVYSLRTKAESCSISDVKPQFSNVEIYDEDEDENSDDMLSKHKI